MRDLHVFIIFDLHCRVKVYIAYSTCTVKWREHIKYIKQLQTCTYKLAAVNPAITAVELHTCKTNSSKVRLLCCIIRFGITHFNVKIKVESVVEAPNTEWINNRGVGWLTQICEYNTETS